MPSLSPSDPVQSDAYLENQSNLPIDPNNTFKYIFSSLQNFHILRRIPKGARAQVARALGNVLQAILADNSNENWEALFAFSICLRKPTLDNKNSLTSKIKDQVNDFERWRLTSPRETIETLFLKITNKSTTPLRSNTKGDNNPNNLRKAISRKLEELNVKGAARLASSTDKLIQITESVRLTLILKHPPKFNPTWSNPPTITSSISFDDNAVAKAIRSFPCGSSAGPDKLSPAHLKDLIAHNNGSSSITLSHLTTFVNFVISGSIPQQIRPYFFGAQLIAFQKPDGGIRPIAIGLSLRRLCSKLCAQATSKSLSSYLAPHQVGCGTPLGAEAIVHAARQVINQSEVTIKIDFKNAFNSISRNVILDTIKTKAPEIYNYTLSSYGGSSQLFIQGQEAILSSEGIQQGDPLGPLLFSSSIHPTVIGLKSPFNEWYLDDGTLGGTLEDTASDLDTLMSISHNLNLSLNSAKTEIIIKEDVTDERKQFIRNSLSNKGGDLKFIKSEEAILLGAPITEEAILPSLILKLVELKRLVSNLKLLDSHDALFLLKNCFAIPKLLHIFRSGACFQSELLKEFDLSLKLALGDLLNVNLDDKAWIQASLPVHLGGLGIREPSSVALSAFLASYHGTRPLVEAMLTDTKFAIDDHFLTKGLLCWPLSNIPELPMRHSQHAWDSLICKNINDSLLTSASNPTDRARLLAARSQHANDWLMAAPISQIGLKLEDNQLRINVGLLLGTPICHPHLCI